MYNLDVVVNIFDIFVFALCCMTDEMIFDFGNYCALQTGVAKCWFYSVNRIKCNCSGHKN